MEWNLSERMHAILKNTEELSKSLIQKEGTLGLLLHDQRLYEQLSQTTQTLHALLKGIQRHPQRYVHFSLFGAKQPLAKAKKSA